MVRNNGGSTTLVRMPTSKYRKLISLIEKHNRMMKTNMKIPEFMEKFIPDDFGYKDLMSKRIESPFIQQSSRVTNSAFYGRI